MKKELLKILLISIFLAIFIVLFQITLYESLTIVLFIGITVTFTAGADKTKTPNYLFSAACGVGWGFIFFQMKEIFEVFGFSEQIKMILVFFIFTLAIKSVHSIFLKNTWANMVGFVFAGVIGVVYIGTDDLLKAIITLSCGILNAVISVLIADILTKQIGPKSNIADKKRYNHKLYYK